ncbi:MAG TPA: YbaB/EbfC family nucleoid-associated protein [Thermodesulfobacteriota bacterium]|nr:YbaB/EbfC family nucleoid-associated protein [Thermodesulfobacteriota bacterium]
MKDISNIMKQAQKMQEKLALAQKELALRAYEASSGGGMVKAVVNGSHRVVSIKIDPSVVNPDDVPMLEDLIVAAVNEASKRAQEDSAEEMGKITSGMGINIPGLF